MDTPTSTPQPELFNDGVCNRALPVREVVESFDFGQFVDLLTVDQVGQNHAVILEQSALTATAKAMTAQSLLEPPPTVPAQRLGGIPLIDVATGATAGLQQLTTPIPVEVADVDELIRQGRIETAGGTVMPDLDQTEVTLLRAGHPIIAAARVQDDRNGDPAPTLIRLSPKVVDIPVPDLDELLARGRVSHGGQPIGVRLTADEIRPLLSGQPVIGRIEADGRTQLVRLSPSAGVQNNTPAEAPASDQHAIHDLAGFLAHPVIPGIDGRPYHVELQPETIGQLRTEGFARVPAGSTPVKLAVVQTSAQPLRMTNGGGDGGGDLPLGGGSPVGGGAHGGGTPVGGGAGASTGTGLGPVNKPVGLGVGSLGLSSDTIIPTQTQPVKTKPTPDAFAPMRRPVPFTIQVAVFLPWRQEWVLKGYTRGHLLQSLTLAPQEETTIELFTWDRKKKTLEQSTTTDVEQSFDDSTTASDTTDVYRELTRNNEFQWQASGSVHATYKPMAGEISVGVDAGAKNQAAVGNIGKTTANTIHESVNKAAVRVKTSRVTRITETVEQGREDRVTRNIRNPNMCHTLNLHYYEVLANYTIATTFRRQDARLCAMIENPISVQTFNRLTIRTHETALRNALLDPALSDGFAACRLLQAWENATEILKTAAGRHATEAPVSPLPPPPIPPQGKQPATKEERAVLALTAQIGTAYQQLKQGDVFPALALIRDHQTTSLEVLKRARRWLYLQLLYRYWPSFHDVLEAMPTSADTATTEQAQRLNAGLPDRTGMPSPSTLNDLSDTDKEVVLGPAIHTPGYLNMDWDWGWWSGRCREEGLYMPDDAGLAGFLTRFADAYQAYLAKASEPDDLPPPGATAMDKANQLQQKASDEDKLEMKYDLADVASAQEREQALQQHLNDHSDYYRYVLFQALPPSEQLDQLIAQTGNKLRVGLFEPRVVSMRGRFLAVPLHTALEPALQTFLNSLLDGINSIGELQSDVTVPTPGLAIDSRLGNCSACEDFIEDSRAIELRRLDALARQQEQEAERLKARLAANPPLLDDPRRATDALHVQLDQQQIPPSSPQ
jgi:hypothetical protein